MVVVLFFINLIAMQREHSAKAAASQALALAEATDQIKFQMMQNRLYLGNYLLSGDTRESRPDERWDPFAGRKIEVHGISSEFGPATRRSGAGSADGTELVHRVCHAAGRQAQTS